MIEKYRDKLLIARKKIVEIHFDASVRISGQEMNYGCRRWQQSIMRKESKRTKLVNLLNSCGACIARMNIIDQESNLVKAKTCGCEDKETVTYVFSEPSHALGLDKKAIVEAEIQACEILQKDATNESEKVIVEKEIEELRMALDLLT